MAMGGVWVFALLLHGTMRKNFPWGPVLGNWFFLRISRHPFLPSIFTQIPSPLFYFMFSLNILVFIQVYAKRSHLSVPSLYPCGATFPLMRSIGTNIVWHIWSVHFGYFLPPLLPSPILLLPPTPPLSLLFSLPPPSWGPYFCYCLGGVIDLLQQLTHSGLVIFLL